MNTHPGTLSIATLHTWLIATSLWLLPQAASGGDWPMWRHDAGRSAASPEKLPGQPALRWVRRLVAPRPAWPNEERLQFDASNEPVVMGKTLFVGSALEGSLTALDTEAGAQRWKFLARGPMVLADLRSS
ncbi:MAG: hypothetical protein JNM65_09610 [Verrucomicrobiaceae bacterium]|nr:hypothetical protein [Verrucomicrobiaceae bacterium]